MHKIVTRFLFLMGMMLVSSCAQTYTPENPQAQIYTPRYIDFTYKIDDKVQIRHSYLFGVGVKKCYYAGELATPYMEDYQLLYPYKSDVMRDFFEKNGHIYQGRANRDKNILGYPHTSQIGTRTDPGTGEKITMIHKLWLFDSLCGGYVGPFSFSIKLQKSSYLSIAEEIAQTKELLGSAWKEFARWEPESTVQRGNNTWTVLKTWNRAFYLADATEEWYLPVADGAYYYSVSFSYKTPMLERDPDQYAKGRAMFDHILDSFVVRQLSPEESAAIVNPEPIEIQPSQMGKRDREDHERYRQELIDRLHRHDSANNKTMRREVME